MALAVGGGTLKRLLVGRPLRSQEMTHTLLPKWLALPVFASDPISSVAYATEEIVLVLAAGGASYLASANWVATVIAALLVIVVLSYRQTCYAYPNGGGAFTVSLDNLGETAALTAAAALLVDYVMTVAVSVVAGVAAITSAKPSLQQHAVGLSVGFVVLLVLLNLRGVRESGRLFAIPTYAFIGLTFAMFVVAGVRDLSGTLPQAATAGDEIHRTAHVGGMFTLLLLLKAFASGCTALTGVEAISNGVPAFRAPKSRNAARTLTAMGLLCVSMFAGITVLALHLHARARADGNPSVISQLATASFGDGSVLFYLYQAVTAAILVLAANTAFNGFPVLSSILAKHEFLPRQMRSRGDKLVYSNGIALLAGFAIALIVAFDANVDKLIQLYILGVFTSFTLSQAGMVRHWTKAIKVAALQRRNRIRVARTINAIGAVATALVLVIVTWTKFLAGAWLALVAMAAVFALMRKIRGHYLQVAAELEVPPDSRVVLPARNHALVVISKLHLPSMRALSYARGTRPTTLAAVTVSNDSDETARLLDEWGRRNIDVPLVILDSPYRELTQPLLEHIRRVRRDGPRDVVTVFIPEYVVGKWWEQLLHNQSALRLKARLLFETGVMVVSVPWQLHSADPLTWVSAPDR